MVDNNQKPGPRERILEKACDLFYIQGFKGTGINQVIEESGVAKASFYKYFPSKDDLLLAYLQRLSEVEAEDFWSDVRKQESPHDRFYAPLDLLEPWLYESQFRGCPFQNAIAEIAPPNVDVFEIVRTHHEKECAAFKKLSEEYFATLPGYEDVDCESFAETYLVIFEGAIATSCGYRDTWPLEKAKQSVKEHVARLAPKVQA